MLSFRCATVGTFVATDTIDGVASMRAYTVGTFVATDTVDAAAYEAQLNKMIEESKHQKKVVEQVAGDMTGSFHAT